MPNIVGQQKKRKGALLAASCALAFALVATGLRAQVPAGSQANPSATLLTDANQALEKEDYPRALQLLTTLARESPNDPRILYDLAYTEDALDQTTSAEASYRLAIAAGPTLIEPRLSLGLLLARTGHPAEARTELAAASTLPDTPAPLRARAFRALARLELKAHPAAAGDDLLQALKLSPETPEDTLMAAELADAGKDPATAEMAYRRALAASPDDPGATAALAHLLAATQPAEAETLLTAALAAHSGDPSLTAQLSTLYAAQNKFAPAIALIEPLHTAHPADAGITRLLAHLDAQSGAYGKADPLFAALIARNPEPTLLDDRADALIHLHRYAEAEALLTRALALGPAAFPTPEDFGIAASHLAFAAENNNDPQATLRALGQRATVLPPSPSAMFLEATAYDKLHDYKHASGLYKQFLNAAAGKFPDEEFEARHRLLALSKRNEP